MRRGVVVIAAAAGRVWAVRDGMPDVSVGQGGIGGAGMRIYRCGLPVTGARRG